MLRDVFLYFLFYLKFIKEKKAFILNLKKREENKGDDDTPLFLQNFFFYYLRTRLHKSIVKTENNKNNIKNEDTGFDVDDLSENNASTVTTTFNKSTNIDIVDRSDDNELVEDSLKESIAESADESSEEEAEYIYNQCVFISPFVPETIVQLLFITKNFKHITNLKKNNYSNIKIYDFLFENGYVEIQKTSVDNFIERAAYICQNKFRENYPMFKKEMIRIFTLLVKRLRCFKEVYLRECIAEKIKAKYRISEIAKMQKYYNEDYEQKNVNRFVYYLRDIHNPEDKCRDFIQVFPDASPICSRSEIRRKHKKED